MNTALLTNEVQKFIRANTATDTYALALKKSPFPNLTMQELLLQIEARKRCKTKLPTWFATQKIYYPNKLNIEQASSEIAANYKASLVSGKTLVDATGGFGVDAYYFSKVFSKVIHCEINEELSQIVAYNAKPLACTNVQTQIVNGIDFILKNTSNYSCIYLDPSRRTTNHQKVFKLKDYTPNITNHLETLLKKTDTLLLKTSPLLDISKGLQELTKVQEIHCIAVNNEVKELLWCMTAAAKKQTPQIYTVNIKAATTEKFSFSYAAEKNSVPTYSTPKKYVYEPNAAILKAGAFNSISISFFIAKLHKHSHLYTSNTLIDFPGRRFLVQKVIEYTTASFKKEKIIQANITTRNFPESVSNLRKKYKIKEGGNLYLFFTTTSANKKVVLLTKKVTNSGNLI